MGSLDIKFGVKATRGAGRVIEAFLTAIGEATVEIAVKLTRPVGGDRPLRVNDYGVGPADRRSRPRLGAAAATGQRVRRKR